MEFAHVPGDGSLAFLSEGYRFGMHRFDRLGTDAFTTRLLLRPVTVVRGAEASRFFYESGALTRTAALPRSVLHSLQDEGSVQTLDGEAHRERKAMFLDFMRGGSMESLRAAFQRHWHGAVAAWSVDDRIVLQDELHTVLTRTACEWAGVPLHEFEVRARAREFQAMIDNAGSFGLPNWYGRTLRLRTEAWARSVLTDAADGTIAPPHGSALAVLAAHTTGENAPLDLDTAAVELLNVLRPTVAVARFIVFAAWALRRHPVWQERFAAGDDSGLYDFVQEVRRFSPFFPVVGGTVATPVSWAGREFESGDWLLLDLFATNRHPALWSEPELFRPERFAGTHHDHNSFIPQGGGDSASGHRCPGEDPTIELIAESVRLLTRGMSYRVPEQDLRVNLRRMPALPQSGFVIADVKPAELTVAGVQSK